ncbi:choice-of-anchor X domain-containing protein, partial [Ruminococcus flavefaciens]|uniref:choice-of-anchor X domain-containing protein n=1 Tax=Ruminococcus flavefaciens TaxID=1265 RepID=UPI000561EDAA
MKFKRILISTLLIASVTSSTGCSSDFFAKKTNNPQAGAKQQVYAPELDPGVHELITDQRFKSLESDEPLRFETAVTPEEAENGTAVELRDNNGKTISKMYDDGSHSDRIAGDGIYTCSYKPKPNGEETFSYTANIGGEETKPASVRYFDKITKQDIEDMQGISQKASDIESKYLDSEGYVPEDKKEDVLDEIGNYAEELKQSGEAVEYRVNKQYDNVIIKLSSGITMVYDNPTKEDAGGESSTSDTSGGRIYSVQKLNVKGYQPFSETDPHFGDNLPNVINNITSEFSSDIKSNGVTSGEDASPQVVKTFGANQVIFWAGHGGYDGNIHSYLCTTSEFNKDDYTEDDVIEDRLLVELKKSNTVRITSEYINAHCPNMTDSYVYLGSCHSLQDSVLAA